jgi:hypothetical protein
MGGRVPLGYDLKDRQLIVNAREAALVRHVYERYLALGCVSKLRAELIAQGIVSKRRVSRRGSVSGALAYSRGALYWLLKNRLYRGEIAHRGAIYPGDHAAIVERELWERVQQHLGAKRKARREGEHGRTSSLLSGLIYDHTGQRYTPSHTLQHGKRYRYYVAQRPQQTAEAGAVRIPAEALETLVVQRLQQLLLDQLALLDALSAPGDDAALLQALLNAARARGLAWPNRAPEQVRQFVRAVLMRITVAHDTLVIALNRGALRSALLPGASAAAEQAEANLIELCIDARIERRGRSVRLVVRPHETSATAVQEDQALIEVLAQGQRWFEQLLRGEVASLRAIAQSAGTSERHVSQVIRTAFLAPDLVEALLQGRRPARLSVRGVMKELPWDWNEQRRRLDSGRV